MLFVTAAQVSLGCPICVLTCRFSPQYTVRFMKSETASVSFYALAQHLAKGVAHFRTQQIFVE